MARGAAWMVLFKLVERGLGLCSIVILARLLVPADFGLVALATAIIAVLEVFGAFSFDVALIQRPDAERSHYDTAWTFNVIIGMAACVLVLALAHPAAGFYEEPRLRPLMYMLALGPLVGAFENIGIVVFRKEMQFQKEFAFLITKKLISVTATLILTFTLRNYWALAIGILIGRGAGTVLSYIVNAYRPRFSLEQRRDLMHFSSWSLLNNLLNFLSGRTGDFVIGKTAGPATLGTYNLAFEISTLPTTELGAPINRAVFPAYAKMSGDTAALQKGYLSVLGIIALLTVPAALGIAATASVLIPLVFGQKWLAAIPLVQVLAFFGLIQALQNNVGPVYYALGKPRTATLIALVYNAIMVPSLLFGSVRWGGMGAAIALLGSAAIVAPLNLFIALTMLKLRGRHFIAEIWRPACAGLAMLAALLGIKPLCDGLPAVVEQLMLVAAGIVVYVTVVAVLWMACGKPEGAESKVLQQIRNKRVML